MEELAERQTDDISTVAGLKKGDMPTPRLPVVETNKRLLDHKMKAFGITSIGGSQNRENQDVFFIKGRTVGIFDGHGRNGLIAATKAAAVFEGAAAADAATFAAADAAVCTAMPAWQSGIVGGTTATVVQIAEDGGLTVAHVGDSEVWIFDAEDAEGRQITEDHSPLNLAEYKRVRATALHPTEFRFATINHWETGRPVFVSKDGDFVLNPAGGHYHCDVRGTWAANIKGHGASLALSRALGDTELKPYGISAVPSVIVTPPPAAKRAIVVASDGLWDILTPAQVRAVVFSDHLLGDASAAATALMAAANEAGTRLFGTDYDNITLVVIYV